MKVQLNTLIQPSELCVVRNLIIFSITIFVPNSAKKKKTLIHTKMREKRKRNYERQVPKVTKFPF